MAISKRLRYEVLRRDGHACWYCGTRAPEVKLVVDAVVPEALGGSHKDPANLRTACDPCNNGKSSSNPDAPLVAAVSEDALRWSAAMAEASVRMRAELAGRIEVYNQLEELWGGWTYGFKKEPIPKPDDWRNSVDNFLAAGLPLDVLQWCISRAMASKAKPDQTWRYMCGIAWKKVSELQEAARSLAAGVPAGGDDEELSPEEIKGRASLACELLSDCDPAEIDALIAEARENWQAETEDQADIAAAQIAWQQARIDLSWLAFSVCDLLPMLPDGIIQEAMREARVKLYDEHGPGFSRAAFAAKAVDIAAILYATPLACIRTSETAPF